jgi:hypothetical protein
MHSVSHNETPESTSRTLDADTFPQNRKTSGGSGSDCIKFADLDFGMHGPDASFKHLKAKHPGVVNEVSCSQKKRDLQRLNDDYILGSDGSMRLVVGIHICHNKKGATMSTWQPRFQINNPASELHYQELLPIVSRLLFL